MFCPLKESNLVFPRWIGINKPIWCNWSLVFKIKYLKICYKDIIFCNVEIHDRRSRSQNRVNMNGMNTMNAQSL